MFLVHNFSFLEISKCAMLCGLFVWLFVFFVCLFVLSLHIDLLDVFIPLCSYTELQERTIFHFSSFFRNLTEFDSICLEKQEATDAFCFVSFYR